MKSIRPILTVLLLVLVSTLLYACSTWEKLNTTEKGAVIGGGTGAVIGSHVGEGAGGALIGGAGGAVVGGAAGHMMDRYEDDDY